MFASKIEQGEVGFYTLLTDRLTDRQKDGQSHSRYYNIDMQTLVTQTKTFSSVYQGLVLGIEHPIFGIHFPFLRIQ